MQRPSRPTSRFLTRGLALLYEDRDILVVDKPAGLLTVGTEREKARTAYWALTDYVRKGAVKSRNRIFIVHRLDRDTSGVLVFAKTAEAKFDLQRGWDETKKRYLAVVHGQCAKRAETITSYLAENRAHGVYATPDPQQGKWAQTAYTVLKETRNFTLLEVALLTGRKNQIRVHLAGMGHPIVGDVKYGKADESHKRMALHALSISFKHPFSGRQLKFESEIPDFFSALVGRIDRRISPTADVRTIEHGQE